MNEAMPATIHRDVGHVVAPKTMYFMDAFESVLDEQDLAGREDDPGVDRLAPVIHALALAVVLSAIEDSRNLEGISPDMIDEARRVAVGMPQQHIVIAARIAIAALSGSEPANRWNWDEPATRQTTAGESATSHVRRRLGEWVGKLARNCLVCWPAYPGTTQFSAGLPGHDLF